MRSLKPIATASLYLRGLFFGDLNRALTAGFDLMQLSVKGRPSRHLHRSLRFVPQPGFSGSMLNKLGVTMRSVCGIGILLAAVCGFGSATFAAETVTYTYDAKGRLVKVERSGGVNNGVKAEYTHDRANNRRNLKVTGSSNQAP
jgi:hypothetical protein